jgi:hypothetical protein
MCGVKASDLQNITFMPFGPGPLNAIITTAPTLGLGPDALGPAHRTWNAQVPHVDLLLSLTSENFGRKMYARTSSYPNLSYTALTPDNDYRGPLTVGDKEIGKKKSQVGFLTIMRKTELLNTPRMIHGKSHVIGQKYMYKRLAQWPPWKNETNMASEVAAETGTGYVDGNRPGNGEWETSTRNRPSMEAGQTLKTDLEAKVEEVEIPFRFWARKRLEAIAALGGLIAISILPLFTIGGSIGMNPLSDDSDCSKHGSRYWRRE